MVGVYVCYVRFLFYFVLSLFLKKLIYGFILRFDESYVIFVFILMFFLIFILFKLVFGLVVKKVFVIFLIFFEILYVNIGGGIGEGVYIFF